MRSPFTQCVNHLKPCTPAPPIKRTLWWYDLSNCLYLIIFSTNLLLLWNLLFCKAVQLVIQKPNPMSRKNWWPLRCWKGELSIHTIQRLVASLLPGSVSNLFSWYSAMCFTSKGPRKRPKKSKDAREWTENILTFVHLMYFVRWSFLGGLNEFEGSCFSYVSNHVWSMQPSEVVEWATKTWTSRSSKSSTNSTLKQTWVVFHVLCHNSCVFAIKHDNPTTSDTTSEVFPFPKSGNRLVQWIWTLGIIRTEDFCETDSYPEMPWISKNAPKTLKHPKTTNQWHHWCKTSDNFHSFLHLHRCDFSGLSSAGTWLWRKPPKGRNKNTYHIVSHHRRSYHYVYLIYVCYSQWVFHAALLGRCISIYIIIYV